MKKFALIVAGGSGQRMGAALPKQFLLLQNKPLLCYSIEAFIQAFDDHKIILVLPPEHLTKGEEIISQYQYQKVILTAGGETRFHSVQNGLRAVTEPSIIFVHDGVRCMVTTGLIRRCYKQALEKGSAIPAVAATDSIRIDEGSTHHIIDRNKVRIIQTPQTFRSEILVPAYEQEYQSSFTDEAGVVESSGQEVFLIEGEYDNLKITRPIDIFLAEKILESR
ncbi:MAG TPA: 2-C-methyl-D-erythritol 4-phosphate cytidylyltransferase [Segetibacter sp.]|jgi:2-C-methyl-D-erythritol 4-phosphate cytidylyltransferase